MQGQDGSKNLQSADIAIVAQISENSRVDVVWADVSCGFATNESLAIFASNVEELAHILRLDLIDLWTEVRILIGGVSEIKFLDGVDQELFELVGSALFDI